MHFDMRGGHRLEGAVAIHSAKNAVLPILAASILADDPVTILDCPRISDAQNMLRIVEELGCGVRHAGGGTVIDASAMSSWSIPDWLAKKLRSSIFIMGPILGKCRKAMVTHPGGCEIGMRPIDLHIRGLSALGVVFEEDGERIRCDGGAMRGGEVHFDYPSVGATENVMMAAALIPGDTTIHNAAKEPEIVDLQRFMNAMGARIRGAGTHTITVEGVKRLRGVSYRPMFDRIVAGTLLAAGAITGGELQLDNTRMQELVAVTAKLRDMGCDIAATAGGIHLRAPKRLQTFGQLQTQPHPGFPTDMQVQMLALSTVAAGTSIVTENVFENRFAHAADLNRMGADIVVHGRTAVVRGVERLHGASVQARDLRGGAALVLAGLAAHDTTRIARVDLIDRGYEALEDTLTSLGADIRRVKG
ncbi:MAG: UDP-N-acetylglucosamine 1-carboxyvinyltransferase [Oscillospiraceae bacterium]|jgi:UDP-N-acetylglucosamine 1-carboxyvinyltransferase|nr:UDP-N-acetylglucosamine 1-carboxyvinyltransferase [Oscillospiraceae bacterium]